MRVEPLLEQVDHLLDGVAQPPAAERACDKRLASVGRRNAEDRLDAARELVVAFRLGAVVLQRALAHRLGDGDHVGLAHGAAARERHVGQIGAAVGEQHAAAVVAVLGVEAALDAVEHLEQVAVGAQHLLGSERAVQVAAAGTRERRGIDHGALSLAEAVERFGDECGGDQRLGRLERGFGQFQRAALALFVDGRRFDGRRRLAGERPLHQRVVLLRLLFALISICHGCLRSVGVARTFP